MEQVKFFSFRHLHDYHDYSKCQDEKGIENEVNRWLLEMGNKIEITQRFVTESDSCWTVTIFYHTLSGSE